jgi:hypothetical protein
MAFTTQQMQDIIYYLGWPGKTILPDSTHYNSVIYSRLVSLIPEIESQATALVTRIKDIDKVLIASIARASTLEVGDIKINQREREELRAERKKVLVELSDLLDIDVMKSSNTSISMVS